MAIFFFKQKTAYEMRISDWSSDVCSSDLVGAAAGAPAQPDDDVRELELVAQTPTVARDGTYEARVRFDGVPADGQVRITLHDRVRSRSELAQSMGGDRLRRDMHDVTAPLAELQTYPDGSRRVAITLDPAAPLGVPLSASGAYPLEIVAQASSGRTLGRLLTHVLFEPQRSAERVVGQGCVSTYRSRCAR